MVSFPLSSPLVKIEWPTRGEWKYVLTKTPIAITVAICVTLVSLGALGSVVFLAATGHDSSVIGIFVAGALAAVGSLWSRRMGAMQRSVDAITAQQTKAGEQDAPRTP